MEEPTPKQRTDSEPEIKPEPNEFPLHLLTVKSEEEESELHHRQECGPFSSSDSKPFSCSECGEMIVRRSDIIRHMRTHVRPKPIVALLRDEKVFHKIRLQNHSSRRSYSCSVCKRTFDTSTKLRIHRKIHRQQSSFVCSVCRKSYKSKSSLLHHKKAHAWTCPECGVKLMYKGEQSCHLFKVHFICPVCEVRFTDRAALSEHLTTHSGVCPDCGLVGMRKSLTLHQRNIHHMCPICEQRFGSRVALKKHLMTHRDDGTLQPSSALICKDCGDLFFYQSELKKHLTWGCTHYNRDRSTEEPEELLTDCEKTEEEAELPLHTVKTEDPRIKTEGHGYEMNVEESGLFSSTKVWASEQTKHQNSYNDTIQHHPPVTEPFSCTEPTPSNYLEKRHVDSSDTDDSVNYSQQQASIKRTYAMIPPDSRRFSCSEPEPLSCLQCGETIEKSADINHMRTHVGLKTFSCSVCGKSFRSFKTYKQHLRSHTEHRHMPCSVCGRCCFNRAMLAGQMRTHKERPFSCSGCGKRFAEQIGLTKHLQCIHHICPLCSKGFKDKHQLKRHLRGYADFERLEVSKPFSCSVCGKRFTSSAVLQAHLYWHSEERPFSSAVCEKRFKEVEVDAIWKHMFHSLYCPVCGIGIERRRGVCPDCCYTISQKSLAAHLRTRHHMCLVCEERLADRAALKEHLKIHIKEGTLQPTSASVHLCSHCGDIFFIKYLFTKHVRICVTKKKPFPKKRIPQKRFSLYCEDREVGGPFSSSDDDSTEDWLP